MNGRRWIQCVLMVLLTAGTASASPAFLSANSPLGEKFLATGFPQVAGDVSAEQLPGSCGSCLKCSAGFFVAPSAPLVEQPRNALGQFAPKAGGEVVPGSGAEAATWDAIANKPGWTVTRGRIYVKDATGQVRVYDGYATSPSGRNIGIEVKSGTGRFTPEQRAFDTRLNSNRSNTATGIGQHEGVIIDRAIKVQQ